MSDYAAANLEELVHAYKQPLTVQRFVAGVELEVPVFGADLPSSISAIGIAVDGQYELGDLILDYQRVFRDGYEFFDMAAYRPEVASSAREVACRAFRCLGFSGIARIDFRAESDGLPQVIEVNSKPHMTTHSSVMQAIRSCGGSGRDLAAFLVGAAVRRAGG